MISTDQSLRTVAGFPNLQGTSAPFVLPAGMGHLILQANDPNNPGVCSLQQLQNGVWVTIASCNTNRNFDLNYGGLATFQTQGGTFQVVTTALASEVIVKLAASPPP
jgi:hypothetical protein